MVVLVILFAFAYSSMNDMLNRQYGKQKLMEYCHSLGYPDYTYYEDGISVCIDGEKTLFVNNSEFEK